MAGCYPNTGFRHALNPFLQILDKAAFFQVTDTTTHFCSPVSASNQCGQTWLLNLGKATGRIQNSVSAPASLCTVSV